MTTRDWCFAAAGLSLALAIGSGVADRRRARRKNADRVGMVNWATVQVFALIATAVLTSIGFNS
ncbi:hypothetical protein ACFO8O_00920 [Hephaestia sp. GCM10023244]|uniref:hypothetical protein n=1 Tax=unclassified Hephaestia TaxID=2631281 RepID=UPI0020774AE3|nr:hypothetical protein [Hephaestia sp. MAHUQ-44]MCM8729530.1 hypothetical protein [Hephaestia sp. MAHUQ-44]